MEPRQKHILNIQTHKMLENIFEKTNETKLLIFYTERSSKTTNKKVNIYRHFISSELKFLLKY